MRPAVLRDRRRARPARAPRGSRTPRSRPSFGAQQALLIAAVLAGAGAAAIVTATATWISRFSAFDALHGEIDDALYLRLTSVAATEKAAVAVGAVLLAIALVAVVGSVLLERRPRRTST